MFTVPVITLDTANMPTRTPSEVLPARETREDVPTDVSYLRVVKVRGRW